MKELLKSVENRTLTDEILRSENIITIVLPMPAKIKGYTEKYDLYFLIYINDCLCDACKRSAVMHELIHIYKNDFDRIDSVEEIEEENPY